MGGRATIDWDPTKLEAQARASPAPLPAVVVPRSPPFFFLEKKFFGAPKHEQRPGRLRSKRLLHGWN